MRKEEDLVLVFLTFLLDITNPNRRTIPQLVRFLSSCLRHQGDAEAGRSSPNSRIALFWQAWQAALKLGPLAGQIGVLPHSQLLSPAREVRPVVWAFS